MRIPNLKIVTVFEIDPSIVLSCGPHLKILSKKLGGQLITINAPEHSPPILPRIVLKLEDTVLNVALDRFDITITPPSHVSEDIGKASKFANQRASTILSELLPAISSFLWTGIVFEFEFLEEPLVSKSAIEAVTPIFDHLVSIDRKNKDMGSFELKFGLRDDVHYINYSISGFESREFKFLPPKTSGYVRFEPSDHPIIECGIKITVDVNNKPSGTTGDPFKDISTIFEKHSNLLTNLAVDLNLEGRL